MNYASNIVAVDGKPLVVDGHILAVPSLAPNCRFAVVSDLHFDIQSEGSPNDVERMMQKIELAGVRDVFCCGDIVTDGSSSSFLSFVKVKDQHGRLKFYSCKGNHDYSIPENDWKSGIEAPSLNYSIERSNYVFLMMSIDSSTNNIAAPYSSHTLDWLQSQLAANIDKQVLLFMHYPINLNDPYAQPAGIRKGGSSMQYGYAYGSQYSTALLDMLKQHGRVVAFSGHSHYAFDVSNYYPGILHCHLEESSSHVDLVHVPSLSIPRDNNHSTISHGNEQLQPSQCYIVDIYDSKLVANGIELNTDSPILCQPVEGCTIEIPI